MIYILGDNSVNWTWKGEERIITNREKNDKAGKNFEIII